MILITTTVIVGFATVYLYGVICEYEYPYLWTLHRVRTARTPNGESVDTVIRKHLGSDPVQWHMCGYCAHRAGESGLQSLELRVRDRAYVVGFDSRRGVVVAMSDSTASAFPELMPRNDTLVPPRDGIKSMVYDAEILIPSSYRGRT